VIAVKGDALDGTTFADQVAPSDTFIQLVGVAHPSPAKAEEFRRGRPRLRPRLGAAAQAAGVKHFIYLSVAQPAPIMQTYVDVRAEGERLAASSGMRATFVRPWYVLGPGHRWPYAILPLYWLWMLAPRSRDTGRRLYPVKLRNVLRVLRRRSEPRARDDAGRRGAGVTSSS